VSNEVNDSNKKYPKELELQWIKDGNPEKMKVHQPQLLLLVVLK
jgi:hypothetical protein